MGPNSWHTKCGSVSAMMTSIAMWAYVSTNSLHVFPSPMSGKTLSILAHCCKKWRCSKTELWFQNWSFQKQNCKLFVLPHANTSRHLVRCVRWQAASQFQRRTSNRDHIGIPQRGHRPLESAKMAAKLMHPPVQGIKVQISFWFEDMLSTEYLNRRRDFYKLLL